MESSISRRFVEEISTVGQGGAAVLRECKAVWAGSLDGCLDGSIVGAVAQLPGQPPRLRMVQIMQVCGEDEDPEPREPGRLQGRLVQGYLTCGQLGNPADIEEPRLRHSEQLRRALASRAYQDHC